MGVLKFSLIKKVIQFLELSIKSSKMPESYDTSRINMTRFMPGGKGWKAIAPGPRAITLLGSAVPSLAVFGGAGLSLDYFSPLHGLERMCWNRFQSTIRNTLNVTPTKFQLTLIDSNAYEDSITKYLDN